MSLYLITPPTEEVVTLAEAKKHLRQTSTDYDELIQMLIAAAVQQLDPAGGGWLARALRPQTWELRGNGFPFCGDVSYGYVRGVVPTYVIPLPYPPLISVDSVIYIDDDDVEQTLVEDVGFRVIGLGDLNKSYIAPVYNGAWPSSVRSDAESVRIRYTCGYEDGVGDSPSIDRIPAPIKQAVLLMVKNLFGLAERNLFVSSETVDGVGAWQFIVTENAAIVMRTASESLLSTYRVFE